tara:strand:- start:1002 stop:1412 length:411 start_codon:yes stop_codon:yes gene_type:complete
MIGKAIYNILITNTNVGNTVGTRIYPNINYEGLHTYPFVVYSHTIDEPHDTKSGVSTLNTATIQINCYDNSKLDAEQIAQYVRVALDRTKGTYNTVIVQSIQYTDQSDSFDLTGYEDFSGIYQVSQTYKVRYEPVN